MRDIFESDDFKEKFTSLQIEKHCAKVANEKLKEWLGSEGVVVYGNSGHIWGLNKSGQDTRKAILVCIEPIEKECNHVWLTPAKNRTVCKMCGVDGRVEVE